MRRSSEDTKALILRAAREHFAADGYDRATIRAIAATAGIDPSMVIRYFGSKERLFATAADIDLRLPDLGEVPRDQVGNALAAHLVDRWGDGDVLPILLRTAVTNEGAADRMRTVFAGQLAPLIIKLVDDPSEAPARAGLAATQALGFALCRHVLALPPVLAMSREETIAWLGPTFQRYLAGPR
ncbi:TetR family transcriptional regulator [Spirillospora sp. NPDC047279]|uniref:TetR/AcrR family transcriptional regulator n=1 Tax=Spirillospora sp. NPDC047279 TaxID=3155478 RepID=UPI00340217E9